MSSSTSSNHQALAAWLVSGVGAGYESWRNVPTHCRTAWSRSLPSTHPSIPTKPTPAKPAATAPIRIAASRTKPGAQMRPKQAFSPRFFRDSARGFPGHDSVWIPADAAVASPPLPLASMIGETGICLSRPVGHLGVVDQLLDQPNSGGRASLQDSAAPFRFCLRAANSCDNNGWDAPAKGSRRILHSMKTKMSFCTRLDALINHSQNLGCKADSSRRPITDAKWWGHVGPSQNIGEEERAP
jgi:hypothetical protein